MKINFKENIQWLAKNHLGLAFWEWCARNGELDATHPESLQLYRNEVEKHSKNEDMKNSYFSNSASAFFDNGFILRWRTPLYNERLEIWNGEEKEIDMFREELKKEKIYAEKYQIKNGLVTKLA